MVAVGHKRGVHTMSDFFLFTISLAATVLGLAGSWTATRKRGVASGMRGAAWSLVPIAAYLTGLTKFLADLAFSPVKWVGVALFGLGALLYVSSGMMLRKGGGGQPVAERKPAKGASGKAAPKAAIEKRSPAADPDLAEIQEILKNRGIS
jgi:hypothetical protein